VSNPMNFTEADRTGDAWEGDAGLTGQAAENFNAPASLPGFGVDAGVPGAIVRPGEEPVPGAMLNDAAQIAGASTADSITADMPTTQVSQFEQASNQFASNMQSSVENLSGLTASPGVGIPGMPGGSAPDQTAAPNPATYATPGMSGVVNPPGAGGQLPGAGPMAAPGAPGAPGGPGQPPPAGGGGGGAAGYLSANVPGATDSLTSAVAAAASSSGPHAALVAGTAVLSGIAIMVGGMSSVGHKSAPASIMAFGSEGGSAPQFASDTHGWFTSAVAAWAAANPPPLPPPPPIAGDGPPVPGGGGAVGSPGDGTAGSSPAPPPTAGGPMPMPGMTPADMIPGSGGGANVPGQFSPAGPMAPGPMTGQDAATPAGTNQSVGGAVMGKVDNAIGSFDHPGTGFNSEAWTGQSVPNEGVWDNMGPGIQSHGAVLAGQAKDMAQGGQGILNRAYQGDDFAGYRNDDNGIVYSNPDDAAFVAQTMQSLGAQPAGFSVDNEATGIGDPVKPGAPNPNAQDMWSSPLGGMGSVRTQFDNPPELPDDGSDDGA